VTIYKIKSCSDQLRSVHMSEVTPVTQHASVRLQEAL